MACRIPIDGPATIEELESDIRLLARLAEELPSKSFIARLSESDIQDNIPLYIDEIEAAVQSTATGYASEIAKQVITAVRNAAEAGDIRQGVGNAFSALHEACSELHRLSAAYGEID
ncbi:hypothetical protein [Sedimentitalea xiamensis]|uniref:hypothetical protein n=1 Tax=Sedimentitalea xiamensis TaxID=3050037 RepID=UPI00253FB7CE|nr:hypothetical protein [Sedimentitalea xiamensis]